VSQQSSEPLAIHPDSIRASTALKANGETNRWSYLPVSLLPGLLGIGLYLANNLDVIHALIAPPPGYSPFGIQRDIDVANYLTWLQGLGHGWLLPNYHAAWSTPPGLFVGGLIPVSILQRSLSLGPILTLQLFSLASYIFAAYALVLAYQVFCKTRFQAIWSLLLAFSCVPLASLPGFSHLVSGDGHSQFVVFSDGFLRGRMTLPLLTLGTAFQVLSMGLLARYISAPGRRSLVWLALVCLLSALIHPFEIAVTLTVIGIVLVRQFGLTVRNVINLCVTFGASCVGLFPYVLQSFRVPWVREIAKANSNFVKNMPAQLLTMIGWPAILVALLLLLGFPKDRSREAIVLKTWFLATFLVYFLPGMPFVPHMLDGLFVAVGLLLFVQTRDVVTHWPILSLARFLVVPLLLWTLIPHVTYRWQAWQTGVDTRTTKWDYASAISPLGEFETVQWLREHASRDDLVLATKDAAPWLATAPIHSFASNWLSSLLTSYPNHDMLRNAFFEGHLTFAQAHELLETLSVRFVVVPDGTAAQQYLNSAVLRARFNTWSIYELPGAHMKPYHDARIVRLGSQSK
jgi:hypothetical protein